LGQQTNRRFNPSSTEEHRVTDKRAVDLLREELGEEEAEELLGTFSPSLRRVLESSDPDNESD